MVETKVGFKGMNPRGGSRRSRLEPIDMDVARFRQEAPDGYDAGCGFGFVEPQPVNSVVLV